MPRLSRAIQKSKEGEPSGATERSHQPPGREVISPVSLGETSGFVDRFRSLLGRPTGESTAPVDTISLRQLLENQATAEELELVHVHNLVGAGTTELTPLQVANTLIVLHQPKPKVTQASPSEAIDDEDEAEDEDDAGVLVRPSTPSIAEIRRPEIVSWEEARGRAEGRSMMVDGDLYEKLTGISNQGRSVLSRQLREGIVGKLKHRSYSPADVAAISARLRRPQVYRNERPVTQDGAKLSVDWARNHPIEVIDENKKLLAKRDAVDWFKWSWLRFANPRNAKEWLTPREQLEADWKKGKEAAEKYAEAVRKGKKHEVVMARVLLGLMSVGGDADLQARESQGVNQQNAPTQRGGSGELSRSVMTTTQRPTTAYARSANRVAEVRGDHEYPTTDEFRNFLGARELREGLVPVLDLHIRAVGRQNRVIDYKAACTPSFIREVLRKMPGSAYDEVTGGIVVVKDGEPRPLNREEAQIIVQIASKHNIKYSEVR